MKNNEQQMKQNDKQTQDLAFIHKEYIQLEDDTYILLIEHNYIQQYDRLK